MAKCFRSNSRAELMIQSLRQATTATCSTEQLPRRVAERTP